MLSDRFFFLSGFLILENSNPGRAGRPETFSKKFAQVILLGSTTVFNILEAVSAVLTNKPRTQARFLRLGSEILVHNFNCAHTKKKGDRLGFVS